MTWISHYLMSKKGLGFVMLSILLTDNEVEKWEAQGERVG